MINKFKQINPLAMTTRIYAVISLSVLLAVMVESAYAENEPTQTTVSRNSLTPVSANVKISNVPLWTKEEGKQAVQEKKLQHLIAQNPNSKELYVRLAGLYLGNGKTAQAIQAYQEAIMHDPENPRLFAAISIAYLHQSKYDMSRAMANEALRLNPDLKQVKKINEYIDAKQAILNSASQKSDKPTMHTLSQGSTMHKGSD